MASSSETDPDQSDFTQRFVRDKLRLWQQRLKLEN
jgi:hypothetical protein